MSNYAAETVLGYLFIRPEVLADPDIGLNVEHFRDDRHRHIFAAMLDIQIDGEIDFVSVVDRLRALGLLDAVGGPAYVASLVDGLEPLVPEMVRGLIALFTHPQPFKYGDES